MLKDYPLIGVALGFVLGIIVQFYAGLTSGILFTALLLSLLVILSAKYFTSNSAKFPGHSLFLFPACFLGMVIYQLQNNDHLQYPFSENLVKEVTLVGRIESINLKRENDFSLILETQTVYAGGKINLGHYKIRCQLKSPNRKELKNNYARLEPGNLISITGMYSKGKGGRNPGEFDYSVFNMRAGISGQLFCNKFADLKILDGTSYFFASKIFQMRKALDERIDKLFEEQSAALLKGLMLGDKSEITDDVKTDFINSGVAHVLAVSGLHVGFIALIFIVLFGRANVYLRTFLTMLSLLAFLLITGFQPAVLRATIMMLVILIAFLENRSVNVWNTLAIAALLILLIDSNQLFNPGFQLSFAAVISLVAIFPTFSNWLDGLKIENKFIKGVFSLFLLSFAAQIGVLPLTNYYFGKISLISLLSNLFVIPLISFILANGIVTLFISIISLSLASLFALAGNSLTSLLYWITEFSSHLSFSFIKISGFTLYDGLVFYLCIAFMFWAFRSMQKSAAKLILFILVVLNITVYCSFDNKELLPDGTLSVLMIDVGQGDSFLIKTPDGKYYLIDAGSAQNGYDTGERVILPLLNHLGIEKIDYGFVSHMDNDHFAGFVSLISQNRIGQIVKPDADSANKADVNFEKLLRIEHVPFTYYREVCFQKGDGRVYLLSDSKDLQAKGFSLNDRSGIIKVVFGKSSFLFVGDAHVKMEKNLESRWGVFLKSDALKIGHHGSKTSSSEKFINFVQPEFSLLSVGERNKFGHPSLEILERLNSIASNILRTDKSGAILLQSDGEHISRIAWR